MKTDHPARLMKPTALAMALLLASAAVSAQSTESLSVPVGTVQGDKPAAPAEVDYPNRGLGFQKAKTNPDDAYDGRGMAQIALANAQPGDRLPIAGKVGTANGTLTAYNTKDNTLEVARGCFKGTVDEFLTASEEKHDEQTHLEYRLLIEVAHSRITRAQKDEK